MPAVEAIYHTGQAVVGTTEIDVDPLNPGGNVTLFFYRPRSCFVAVSSVTANQLYSCVLPAPSDYTYSQVVAPGTVATASVAAFPSSAVTVSSVVPSSTFSLLPCEISLNNETKTFNLPVTISITGSGYSENVETTLPNSGSITVGTWSVTQDASQNVLVTCTSFGPGQANRIFYSYNNNSSADLQPIPHVWKVALQDQQGVEITSALVRPSVVTTYPCVSLAASQVTVTTAYNIVISRRVVDDVASGRDWYVYRSYTTVLTAPAVTSGGGGNTNMFSWLNNDYWYLTDLQVNLGTRAVTHRHGTVEIKPNDTVNFAILFHDGTSGKNPAATDLKLAVRGSNNNSPYYFWSAATVTTVSVSGDTYYAITVTASDEDLLAAQVAGLLSGSNSGQGLVAEVQWTTTRGTFSSDSFTISVPNEVIREPDA